MPVDAGGMDIYIVQGLACTVNTARPMRLAVSTPMIKCKKTPKKKCRFMAERRKNDRLPIGQKCSGRESENERKKLDGHTK